MNGLCFSCLGYSFLAPGCFLAGQHYSKFSKLLKIYVERLSETLKYLKILGTNGLGGLVLVYLHEERRAFGIRRNVYFVIFCFVGVTV